MLIILFIGRVLQVTVQYIDDGKLIFGVSISGRETDSEESISVFNEIKQYLNSDIGCITGEEPPPSNSVKTDSLLYRKLKIIGLDQFCSRLIY